MLRARLATAAVALPSLLWLIFWGPPWAFSGVVVALAAVGLLEFASMAAPGAPRAQIFAVATGLCLAWAVVSGRPGAPGLVLALALPAGLVVALSDADLRGAVDRVAHGLLASLYVGFLLPHVVRLHALAGGARWVFFVLACCMAADTAAYFGGRLAGRRKLFARVSPNKTVEGAVSALLGSVLLSWLVVVFLPPPGLRPGAALAFGLVFGVLSQTGDLVESLLKRAYDTKDSGWFFPGHGGVLDRIDALVMPFVFTYYWIAGLGV